MKTPDTMTLVGIVLDAISETGATRVKVDKTGIGQGVTDRLNELRSENKHQAQIVGVMVGSAAHRPDRFPKLRDELWWEVGRTMSENGAWDLSQLDDATAAQLTAPRWAPDSSGRIKVERKEETRKRIGRSPDDTDALLLAFYSGSGSSGAKEWLEALAPLHHCPDGRDTPNRLGLARCQHCGEELPARASAAVPTTTSTRTGTIRQAEAVQLEQLDARATAESAGDGCHGDVATTEKSAVLREEATPAVHGIGSNHL